MVIVRQTESNLLKYNVAGDCLAIKLEGDPKSWTTYFEQIQFWSEIEFLPASFPLPLYNIKEKSGLPVNNIVQCRRELEDMCSCLNFYICWLKMRFYAHSGASKMRCPVQSGQQF